MIELQPEGQLGGDVTSVALSGSIAYVGIGFAIHRFDLSNPAAPVQISSLPVASPIQEITLSNGLIYAACDSGLAIIDYSNAIAPRLVGYHGRASYAYGVQLAQTTAYVALGSSGILVFDLSQPALPSRIGAFDTSGYAYDVAVDGTRAYVADGSSGLVIMDVSWPENPKLLGVLDTTGTSKGIVLSGTRAYVADGSNGLVIVDVSNPSSPTQLGRFDTPGDANELRVVGNLVYVADGYKGVQIVDVTDPASPSLRGTLDTAGQAVNLDVAGDIALIADNTRVAILNVATPQAPVLVYTNDWYGGDARRIHVKDNLVYLPTFENHLDIIDASTPAFPRRIGRYTAPSDCYSVTVVGDLAYLAADTSGLIVLNVSDPTNPVKVGSGPDNSYAQDVQVVGNYAYVASIRDGLQIFDVSNPSSPQLRGACPANNYAQFVEVVGSLAYVADWGKGLQIVDVSDPDNPTQIGTIQTDWFAHEVTVVGSVAYVADDSGIAVIDVANPAAPKLIRYQPDMAVSVRVAGNCLFTTGLNGVQVWDITDPSVKRLIGESLHYISPEPLFVVGDHVFTGNEDDGIAIYKILRPDTRPPKPAFEDFSYLTGAHSLAVGFDENVRTTIAAADLLLLNTTTGQTIPTGDLNLQTYLGWAQWSYSSTTAGGTVCALPTGNYEARILAAGINDHNGNLLDGNGDGVGGDDLVLRFWVLGGDANRDRAVNFADLVAVAQNYNTASNANWSIGDFNGDRAVNFADLVVVAQNYNTELPLPGPMVVTAAASRSAVAGEPVTAATVESAAAPPVTPPIPNTPDSPVKTSNKYHAAFAKTTHRGIPKPAQRRITVASILPAMGDHPVQSAARVPVVVQSVAPTAWPPARRHIRSSDDDVWNQSGVN